MTFDIVPDDKDAKYYYDIISKARISEINIATLKTEIEEGSAKMAELTGTPYEEVLEQILSKGDQLNILSNSGCSPAEEFFTTATSTNNSKQDNTKPTTSSMLSVE